jgi:hypothetical protein
VLSGRFSDSTVEGLLMLTEQELEALRLALEECQRTAGLTAFEALPNGVDAEIITSDFFSKMHETAGGQLGI